MIITTKKTLCNLLCFLLLINLTLTFPLTNIPSLRKQQTSSNQLEAPLIPYNQTLSKQYAYISMITHCTDSQITQWNCKICKNLTLTLTDLTIIQNATYNIYGFIGYSKLHNQIIVSWRGTVDTKNWEVDFKYKLTKYTPRNGTCDNCQVHTGVYQAYRSVQSQVNTHAKNLLTKYPTATLTSTGHSLGGGLSLFTALQLAIEFPNKLSFTYNFGCLRIGNGNFVTFLKSKVKSIYRVVHNKDPVPHLPPYDFGYLHPANEIFYNEQMTSYVVCNDSGEDKTCSNKEVPFLEPSDHTFYFVATDASVC